MHVTCRCIFFVSHIYLLYVDMCFIVSSLFLQFGALQFQPFSAENFPRPSPAQPGAAAPSAARIASCVATGAGPPPAAAATRLPQRHRRSSAKHSAGGPAPECPRFLPTFGQFEASFDIKPHSEMIWIDFEVHIGSPFLNRFFSFVPGWHFLLPAGLLSATKQRKNALSRSLQTSPPRE